MHFHEPIWVSLGWHLKRLFFKGSRVLGVFLFFYKYHLLTGDDSSFAAVQPMEKILASTIFGPRLIALPKNTLVPFDNRIWSAPTGLIQLVWCIGGCWFKLPKFYIAWCVSGGTPFKVITWPCMATVWTWIKLNLLSWPYYYHADVDGNRSTNRLSRLY